MAYKYVAYDADRQVVRGTIAVGNERIAKQILQQSGYNLLALSAVRGKLNLRRQIPSLFGVKKRDVVTFSRMLATLVGRGTNTVVALELLRDQVSNPTFKEVIQDVNEDVRRGTPLSEAMSRHPEVFPPIYCRMIKVSEQTGRLESALQHVADLIEKQNALVSKVGRSLAYPAFVLLVGLGVVALLILVTLPGLAELFVDQGDLPLPTRLMVGLTDFVNTYILLIVGVGLGVALFAALCLKHPGLRFKLDATLLQAPLMGPVIALREMINFSRTASTCLSSSISMPETLALAAQTAGNQVVAQAIENARDEVLKGRWLSETLKETRLFPRPLVQMVKVGEEAGTLGDDLGTFAEMYEAEVDIRVNTLVSVLGPGIMLFLGVFVAFVALSMIMPMYSVLGQIE